MDEICRRVIDGFGIPVEGAQNIVVPILKGKGDTRNCSCYRDVKLLVAWYEGGGKSVRKKAIE